MRKSIKCLGIPVLILILLMFLAACEKEITGVITEEAGSIGDYLGWWQLIEQNDEAPFAYIEITAENVGDVNCYDISGSLVDKGYIDYNEQRALNGNSLIVFIFEEIGEYGATSYSVVDSGVYMNVQNKAGFEGKLEYLDEPPIFPENE